MTRPMTFRRADRRDKKGVEVCVWRIVMTMQERPGCERWVLGLPRLMERVLLPYSKGQGNP